MCKSFRLSWNKKKKQFLASKMHPNNSPWQFCEHGTLFKKRKKIQMNYKFTRPDAPLARGIMCFNTAMWENQYPKIWNCLSWWVWGAVCIHVVWIMLLLAYFSFAFQPKRLGKSFSPCAECGPSYLESVSLYMRIPRISSPLCGCCCLAGSSVN